MARIQSRRFRSLWIAVAGLTLAAVAAWATAGLAATPAGALSLKEMMTQAELVFHGVVENIEYVLSEPTGPGQVRVPYTFVTYGLRQVFVGQAPGSRVTLQFLGGLNSQTMRYMATSQTPQFDLGDEDILFVQGNTRRPCPLVGNRDGRLRVIGNQVYTEMGRAVLLAGDGPLSSGARYRLPEVETTTVAGRVFTFRMPERGTRALPSEAAQAAEVMAVLADLARQLPSPKAFVNARATAPLAGPDMTPAPPPGLAPGAEPAEDDDAEAAPPPPRSR
jgi:hypothetical protein